MESSVVGYLAYNGLLPLSTSSQVEILNQDFRAECLPKWTRVEGGNGFKLALRISLDATGTTQAGI